MILLCNEVILSASSPSPSREQLQPSPAASPSQRPADPRPAGQPRPAPASLADPSPAARPVAPASLTGKSQPQPASQPAQPDPGHEPAQPACGSPSPAGQPAPAPARQQQQAWAAATQLTGSSFRQWLMTIMTMILVVMWNILNQANIENDQLWRQWKPDYY